MSIHEISTQRTDDETPKSVEPIEVPRGSPVARFLREIKRRRVGRAAITYALVVWLNLQVADISFPLLGLPEWSMPLVMMLGLLGFPLVLALAWVFQITPQGIVVDSVDGSGDAGNGRVDAGVNAGLLVLGTVLIVVSVVQLAAVDVAPARPLAGSSYPRWVMLRVDPAAPGAEAWQTASASRLAEELRHQLIAAPALKLVAPIKHDTNGVVVLRVTIHSESSRTRIIATAFDTAAGAYVYSGAFILPKRDQPDVEQRTAANIVGGLGSKLARDPNVASAA